MKRNREYGRITASETYAMVAESQGYLLFHPQIRNVSQRNADNQEDIRRAGY